MYGTVNIGCVRLFLRAVDFESHQNYVIANHFSCYLMKSRRLCETLSFLFFNCYQDDEVKANKQP